MDTPWQGCGIRAVLDRITDFLQKKMKSGFVLKKRDKILFSLK